MPRIKLDLNRRYLTHCGQIAGPFWSDNHGTSYFGKIGAGETSFRGRYDAFGNYRSTSIERQQNPDIDAQFRIVAEYHHAAD